MFHTELQGVRSKAASVRRWEKLVSKDSTNDETTRNMASNLYFKGAGKIKGGSEHYLGD